MRREADLLLCVRGSVVGPGVGADAESLPVSVEQMLRVGFGVDSDSSGIMLP